MNTTRLSGCQHTRGSHFHFEILWKLCFGNPPMAGGGGDATPNMFFQFFSGMLRAFISNKIFSYSLMLGTSFHNKNFSDRTNSFGSKIRQREDAGGGRRVATTLLPWTFYFPVFLTMKVTINLNKFWCGVRQ